MTEKSLDLKVFVELLRMGGWSLVGGTFYLGESRPITLSRLFFEETQIGAGVRMFNDDMCKNYLITVRDDIFMIKDCAVTVRRGSVAIMKIRNLELDKKSQQVVKEVDEKRKRRAKNQRRYALRKQVVGISNDLIGSVLTSIDVDDEQKVTIRCGDKSLRIEFFRGRLYLNGRMMPKIDLC
ncbi:MAG: hypothetical protein WC663_03440 [Patescibacteria group bacterium]|jgi:hypothetical protein